MDDDNDDGFAANRERDLDDILRELEQTTHTAGKRKPGEGQHQWGASRAQEAEGEGGEDGELADMVAMNASNQDLDVTVQVRAKHHVGDDKDVFDQAPAARPKRNQRPTNKKSLGEAEFV
jgi:hypothetical protein